MVLIWAAGLLGCWAIELLVQSPVPPSVLWWRIIPKALEQLLGATFSACHCYEIPYFFFDFPAYGTWSRLVRWMYEDVEPCGVTGVVTTEL